MTVEGKFFDEAGRDLVAKQDGDGFVWELWVEIQTKDAVVRKRYPNNVTKLVSQVRWTGIQDYDVLLAEYVKSQKK